MTFRICEQCGEDVRQRRDGSLYWHACRFFADGLEAVVTDGPDPRWEWVEIRTFAGEHVRTTRGQCKHLAEYVVPVETGGEVVAHLCTTCDAQLPEFRREWRP